MIYLLAGIVLLGLLLTGVKAFVRADAVALARLIRRAGGGTLMAIALLLLLRGRIDFAIAFGSLGAWLLGLGGFRSFGPFRATGGARPRKVSCVRSAMIEMELDHESGRLRGTVLAGPDEGKPLDRMTRPQCEALYRLCCRDDPEGARLLEAYLDRRFPGWRAANEAQGDARQGFPERRVGAMSEDEAYEVLGLEKGASREEVVRSHRSLMKKLHPDHGGTTDLAARINEAKDVLTRRHQ
jgi:hypothetical protein